jgi:hypothetical protein
MELVLGEGVELGLPADASSVTEEAPVAVHLVVGGRGQGGDLRASRIEAGGHLQVGGVSGRAGEAGGHQEAPQDAEGERGGAGA